MKIKFVTMTVGFFDPENIPLRNIHNLEMCSLSSLKSISAVFNFAIFEDAIDIKYISPVWLNFFCNCFSKIYH